MNLEIFSIFDVKAKAFITPFFMPNEDVALRIFGDCCMDITHAFGKNPADYFLYHFGTFSDETGSMSCPLAPLALTDGIGIKAKRTEY